MFKRVLSFFSLLDKEQNLSISNLAVIIVLIKLAVSPSASITEAGTLLIVMANYALKRKTINDNSKPEEDIVTPKLEETNKKLEEIQGKVSALSLQASLKNLN